MIDRVKVTLISGKGGDGKVAFLHEKGNALGGPAGGNGGRGGDIYIIASSEVNTLSSYRFGKIIKSQNGENGHEKNMYGKDAPDVTLYVPIGTVIKDFETGSILADLSYDGAKYLACVGGRGGKGNHCFVNSVRKSPKFAEVGFPGESKDFYFELRVLADVGLIGLPNAGKSTFLSKVSNAHAKIASYPFTTLEPQLGVAFLNDHESFVIADLPGLIEGAHEGKGLGINFLKHVERCRVFIHIVDITSEDPINDFLNINDELKMYSPLLMKRPMIVALNKIDVKDEYVLENIANFKKKFEKKYKIFTISALENKNMKSLLRETYSILKKTPKFPMSESLMKDNTKVYTLKDKDVLDYPFTVRKIEPMVYEIVGTKLVNEVRRIEMNGESELTKILELLDKVGVDKTLKDLDVEDGATIKIANTEFNYAK